MKLKENILNSIYIEKYTKNQTWGYTISVLDNFKNKISYAGGTGYDKVNAAYCGFIVDLFDYNDENERQELHARLYGLGHGSRFFETVESLLKIKFVDLGRNKRYSAGKHLQGGHFMIVDVGNFWNSILLNDKLQRELKLNISGGLDIKKAKI